MTAHPPYFANAEVLSLDPFTIDPDEKGRIGLYHPAKADALAVLIKQHGQNDPIKVAKNKAGRKHPWRLVAGWHRMSACISLGIDVFAIEVLGDDAYLHQIQVSENMDRRELEPLERAMFVRAVADAAKLRVMTEHGVESAQALGGKAKANKVQYREIEKADEVADAAMDNLSIAYGWKAETAEALGLGAKDIQRSMRIHRCIIEPFPELIDAFKDHPVAKVADSLLAICKIEDEAKRRRVIEILIAGPKDLGLAMQMAGLTKDTATVKTDYDKFTSQISGGVQRLNFSDWSRFCPNFARAMSQERRVALRDALNEAIAEKARDAE